MSIIDSIKKVFSEHKEEETDMKFVDVKTVDGRIMRAADLAVEQPVVEITEDGEVPVEDGTYELEDGTQVVVVENIISEIIPSENEEEQPEEVSEEMEEEEQKTEKFYDVFLKDGGQAHVINSKEGEMNEGDKFTIEGKEAAPGEYELNSGETLTVGEAGVIDAITTADDKVVDEETPENEAEISEEEKEAIGVVKNLKKLIDEIKDLKSQFESVKEEFGKIEKENEKLKEEVSKFSKMPSEEPTKTKVDFKKADKNAKLEFFSKR